LVIRVRLVPAASINRSEIVRSSLRFLEGADLIAGLPPIIEALVSADSTAQHAYLDSRFRLGVIITPA